MNPLKELNAYALAWDELLRLSRVAAELLAAGREEEFHDAWTKRRRCFKRLMALRRRLEPALRDWPASAGPDRQQRSRAEELIERMRTAGGDIRKLNVRTARLLQEARARAVGEMTRTKNGCQALRAYSGLPEKRGPSRISRSG